MTRFSFIPLGVGDAFSALFYSSCLLLECDGARLLIDCPHPIRKMLRESGAGVDLDSIDAIALTHLHADHSSGIEGFAYFKHFVLKQRAKIIAHPDVAARLWTGHLSASMDQLLPGPDAPPQAKAEHDFLEHLPILEAASVEIGPFRISCRKTVHHIPTTAFRITAGGRTLGYSADTAFDPTLLDWLAPSDLIIHETNLGVHTPYERLAALAAPLRARMRLIHYPDAFALDSSAIEPLIQGSRYSV